MGEMLPIRTKHGNAYRFVLWSRLAIDGHVPTLLRPEQLLFSPCGPIGQMLAVRGEFKIAVVDSWAFATILDHEPFPVLLRFIRQVFAVRTLQEIAYVVIFLTFMVLHNCNPLVTLPGRICRVPIRTDCEVMNLIVLVTCPGIDHGKPLIALSGRIGQVFAIRTEGPAKTGDLVVFCTGLSVEDHALLSAALGNIRDVPTVWTEPFGTYDFVIFRLRLVVYHHALLFALLHCPGNAPTLGRN